jgi:hypothetical protein
MLKMAAEIAGNECDIHLLQEGADVVHGNYIDSASRCTAYNFYVV